jgi:hypothetical protein
MKESLRAAKSTEHLKALEGSDGGRKVLLRVVQILDATAELLHQGRKEKKKNSIRFILICSSLLYRDTEFR